MRLRVWLALIVALAAAGLSCGCVTRRVMITSDPPAIVYRDGQYLGPTPVEQPFVYYGKYRYRLVADNCAPLDVEPELSTPWYQYPGIDFVFENLLPFTIRDTRTLHFELAPLERVRNDDVRAAGEALRSRGKSIGPAEPRPRNSRNPNASVITNPPLADPVAPPAENAGNPTPPVPQSPVNVAKPQPEGNAGFQTAPVRLAPAVTPVSPDGGSR